MPFFQDLMSKWKKPAPPPGEEAPPPTGTEEESPVLDEIPERESAFLPRRTFWALLGDSSSEAGEALSALKVFSGWGWAAAELRADNLPDLMKDLSPVETLTVFREALEDVLQELGDICPAWMETRPGEAALLLALESEEGMENVKALLQRALDRMKGRSPCVLSAGIGSPVKGTEPLAEDQAKRTAESWRLAQAACSYHLTEGPWRAFTFQETSLQHSIVPEYPLDLENLILGAAAGGRLEKAEEGISSFFRRISRCGSDFIRSSVQRLAIRLSECLRSLAPEWGASQGYSFLCQALLECGSLEQQEKILREALQLLPPAQGTGDLEKSRGAAERACRYIEANFASPSLSVETIAAYVSLSSGYFRLLFKEATGKTPAEYLTDFRMEKAKELLAATELSTKEVASAVGYDNHRYFYSVFKSHTGRTASQFRQSLQHIS